MSEFEFTGTIDSVTVDVSGELIRDAEHEMRVIMARQSCKKGRKPNGKKTKESGSTAGAAGAGA